MGLGFRVNVSVLNFHTCGPSLWFGWLASLGFRVSSIGFFSFMQGIWGAYWVVLTSTVNPKPKIFS